MNKHIPRKRNLYPVAAENVFSKLPHLWLDHSSKWQQLKTCLLSNLHMPASSLWVLSTFHLPGLRNPADYKVSSYTDICSHINSNTVSIWYLTLSCSSTKPIQPSYHCKPHTSWTQCGRSASKSTKYQKVPKVHWFLSVCLLFYKNTQRDVLQGNLIIGNYAALIPCYLLNLMLFPWPFSLHKLIKCF